MWSIGCRCGRESSDSDWDQPPVKGRWFASESKDPKKQNKKKKEGDGSHHHGLLLHPCHYRIWPSSRRRHPGIRLIPQRTVVSDTSPNPFIFKQKKRKLLDLGLLTVSLSWSSVNWYLLAGGCVGPSIGGASDRRRGFWVEGVPVLAPCSPLPNVRKEEKPLNGFRVSTQNPNPIC